MWVAVVVRVVTNDDTHFLQRLDDVRICVKDVATDPRSDFCGVLTMFIHRTDGWNADGIALVLVVFTKPRSHVHNTSSVFGGDELCT